MSVALLLSASFAAGAFGQHAAPASGTAKPVRISFVPPPLEGTISLGIYNSGGKLVRVLHREADIDDLEAGSDALVTGWDGNDSNGVRLAAGKYHARGFVVGDLEIEGVGFFFNDWVVDEDSPRIRRITKIWHDGKQLVLAAEIAGAPAAYLSCDEAGKISGAYEGAPPESIANAGQLPEVSEVIASAPGRDGSLWVIDRPAADVPQVEVKQFSAARELMRRLAFKPEDPQPVAIAAARDSDQIFLLEENGAGQRLRALSLLGTAEAGGGAVSDWKVEFEKKITTHQDFSIAEGKPVVRGTGAAAQKVAVQLPANPLEKDVAGRVELAVGYDASGSFLMTADGLPLQSVSETRNLRRVLLVSRSDKSLDVFQDDAAVVEQFRIAKPNEMMAFDCGEIELK